MPERTLPGATVQWRESRKQHNNYSLPKGHAYMIFGIKAPTKMLVQLNIISVSQILECYNFSVSFQGRFSGGVPEDAECPKSGVLYPKIMKTAFKNIHQRSIFVMTCPTSSA